MQMTTTPTTNFPHAAFSVRHSPAGFGHVQSPLGFWTPEKKKRKRTSQVLAASYGVTVAPSRTARCHCKTVCVQEGGHREDGSLVYGLATPSPTPPPPVLQNHIVPCQPHLPQRKSCLMPFLQRGFDRCSTCSLELGNWGMRPIWEPWAGITT